MMKKLPCFCSLLILLLGGLFLSCCWGEEVSDLQQTGKSETEDWTFDDLELEEPANASKESVPSVVIPEGKPEAKPEVKETPKTDTKKKSSGNIFSNVLGGLKPTTKKKDQTPLPAVPRYRIEEVIPDYAMMIVRVLSLDDFNVHGKTVLGELGLGTFGPLDWMKFTAFADSMEFLDRKRQAALVYLPVGTVPKQMWILPVNDYRGFIESLGADVSGFDRVIPDNTLSMLKKPAGYLAYPRKGYAVLVESVPPQVCDALLKAASFRERGTYSPSAIKHSHLSVEITPLGIQHFVALGNAALSDFSPIYSEAMKKIEIDDPEMKLSENYFNQVAGLIQWVDQNVASLRLDLNVRKGALVTSATILPKPNSNLFKNVNDSTHPQTYTTLNLDTFLKVVPDVPSPLCGQLDITPTMVEKLGPPYHRVRHVEYTFSLPGEREFLAESWCFFLEVDSSEKFVKELIVPNAQKIGQFIGSEKAGEIGAQMLGNMAVRRQDRQLNRRRPPKNTADPEKAAERGERLGQLLGGLIGKSAGEKEGLKTVKFAGYDMYVSDLVFFTEQMKRIRAAEEGQVPSKKPIVLTGEYTLFKLLGGSLNGLVNGDINMNFEDRFGGNEQQNLMARRNCIVVLDKTHLLIVPGNEYVLSMGVENWNRIRDRFVPPENSEKKNDQAATSSTAFRTVGYENGAPVVSWSDLQPNATWRTSWDTMYSEVLFPERHHLRGALRLDLAKAQNLADYLRTYYIAQLPAPTLSPLPAETPAILSIVTTTDGYSCFYNVIPTDTLKNLFQAYLNAKKTVNEPKP